MGGPVSNGSPSHAHACSRLCPVSVTTFPLEQGPRPFHYGRRNVTEAFQVPGVTEDQYIRT